MKHLILIYFIFQTIIAQDFSIKRIMSKPYLWGSRVQSYSFSPTDQFLYIKEADLNVKQVALPSFVSTVLDSFLTNVPRNWYNDSLFVFQKKKQYYSINHRNMERKVIAGHNSSGHFLASKNLKTRLLLDDKLLTIYSEENLNQYKFENTEGISYSLSSISDDGNYLLYTSKEITRERTIYFPNYLPTFTDKGEEKRSIGKYRIYLLDLRSLSNRLIHEQKEGGFVSSISFNIKSNRIKFIDRPIDRKTIQFYAYSIQNKRKKLIYQSRSKQWVNGNNTRYQFSPSGNQLLFVALNNKYDQLFTYNFSSDRVKRQSFFSAQIHFADWLSDSKITFISNRETPLERHIYTIDLKNNSVEKVSIDNGFIRRPKLSPNKRYLAYQFSQLATPDELYIFDFKEKKQTKISNTIPEDFLKLNVSKPELLKIRSGDNKFDIYANFYSIDRSNKPLIVFVHGAGSLQNVLNGWTPAYHREFLFHQLLIRNGYHVLDVDYRGSTGYSHEFTTDVYSHLGKKELADIVTFIQKLNKDGLIDMTRIGIYGGSYGGFMASYAMEFQPDLFKAGAALRSVFKWENYYYTNEWYTRARLGHVEDNPDWYKRSSPLFHIDKIKNPLLILHGVRDNNVPFQDAVQMVQDMIKAGKTFDLMIYPNERHSFKKQESWIDEYSRIYNYFDKYVK